MIETLVLRFGQIEAFFWVVGLVLQLLTLVERDARGDLSQQIMCTNLVWCDLGGGINGLAQPAAGAVGGGSAL